MLSLLAQRMLDEDVRVRWFRGPVGRELIRLVGPVESRGNSEGSAESGIVPLDEAEIRLLWLLSEGRTNAEIAAELSSTEELVSRQLAELFVKIGASSRADATVAALIGKLV
jgi:DNA-binding NarL/FixJ family response regulator